VREIKKVAVVLYTVPITIKYYDDPREKKMNAFQIAAFMAAVQNGPQAASNAMNGFINQMNEEGLSFKFMTQDEMMDNGDFVDLLDKHTSIIMDRKAKAAAERKAKKQSTVSKALGFLSKLSKATGGNPDYEGAGPKDFPEFGMAFEWKSSDSALMGTEGEMDFVKGAIKALGVDAVMVINEPGFSFGCEACVGGTGSGTTHTTFLATMLDRDGEVIMEMRQWWNVGGGSAAMAGYIINPLQHDSLFVKHGAKTARVFANYYREEGGK